MIFGKKGMGKMVNDDLPKLTLKIRPSFHDVDAMGVVWHGNYLKFFERVREELFRKYHFGYEEINKCGYIWPVVDALLKFRQPWILEEEALVTVEMVEYENRLVFQYKVQRCRDNVLLTKGKTVHIAVDVVKKVGVLFTPDIVYEKFGLKKLI